MKTIAILAALGFAVSVQAVSIEWTIGSTLYGVKDGTATQAFTGTARNTGYWSEDFTSPNSAAFVLVYLGVNASATTADKVTSDMIKQTVDASGIVRTAGALNGLGKANISSTLTGADNVVGATYQVFFSYNGELKDIYTDSSLSTLATVTTSVVKDPTTEVFSTSPSPLYAAGSSSTAAYVSVPEPGTAMLALVGIGMLLKRRRA